LEYEFWFGPLMSLYDRGELRPEVVNSECIYRDVTTNDIGQPRLQRERNRGMAEEPEHQRRLEILGLWRLPQRVELHGASIAERPRGGCWSAEEADDGMAYGPGPSRSKRRFGPGQSLTVHE
jgi:hypothetical protein